MANVKVFQTEDLRERDIPWEDTLYDNLVDTRRWYEVRECVFEDEGKFWKVRYQRGLTEIQEMDPFDNDETVKAIEVEPQEVVVVQTVWQTV